MTAAATMASTFYFTFGVGQPYSGHHVKITIEHDQGEEGEAYAKARDLMARWHGSGWAFQYGQKQWDGMEEAWHGECLLELRLPYRHDTPYCKVKGETEWK